jgi:hypothetical protein
MLLFNPNDPERAKELLRACFDKALETDTVGDLVNRLNYLDTYGGTPGNTRCVIHGVDGGDRRAGYSIAITMENAKLNQARTDREWSRIWSGGLVFHEHAGPGYRKWNVHT